MCHCNLRLLYSNFTVLEFPIKERATLEQPPQNSKSSRKLFMYTLIHLPLLMTFMIIGKVSMKDTNAAAVAESALEMAASTS